MADMKNFPIIALVLTMAAVPVSAVGEGTGTASLKTLRERAGIREPHPSWVNALEPEAELPPDVPPITLANDFRASYVIVTPARATAEETYAAGELAHWMRLICGADFVVTNEDGLEDAGRPFVSVGRTKRFQQAGFAAKDLKRDGYRIDFKDGNIFITGGKRHGPVNGVMAMLEEDLGCRWYQPGWPVLPIRTRLTIEPASRLFVSPFDLLRRVDYRDTHDGPWRRRNRVYMGSWCGRFVHTYDIWMPARVYFEEHPEYYSLIDGKRHSFQLCPTDPAVQRIVTENILAALREDPDVEQVDVSPNDGRGYCECARCMEVYQREGKTHMGPLMELLNHVAAGLEEEFPEVRVTTLAYLDTVHPPTRLKPHPAILPWLCTDAHAWSYPDLYFEDTAISSGAMQRWHDQWGTPMIVWDYPSQFHGSLLNMNLPTIARNLRSYVSRGAEGIYFQTMHNPNPGVVQAYQRSWIFAKLGWDPSRDTAALLRDFNYGFYGAAGPEIQALDEFLWQVWEQWYEETIIPSPRPWDRAQMEKSIPTGQGSLLANRAVQDPGKVEVFWATYDDLLERAKRAAGGDQALRTRIETIGIPAMFRRLEEGPGRGAEAIAAYRGLVDEFQRIAEAGNTKIVGRVTGRPKNEDLAEMTRHWRALTEPTPALPFRPLEDGWVFQPDPNDVGLEEGWHTAARSDLAWKPIRIGNWRDQGYDELPVGWYRRRLTITDETYAQKHVWLLFCGVDETGEVFLNGELACAHTVEATGMPRTQLWDHPFVVDVKPYIRPGDNLLAVRVTWTMGQAGIWRPVGLVTHEQKPDPPALTERVLEIKRIEDAKKALEI